MSAGGKRQGAGRKAGPARVAVTVRVNQFTASRFRLYCRLTELSQAKAFEQIVSHAKLP